MKNGINIDRYPAQKFTFPMVEIKMLIPFFMLAVLFTKNRFARFFIYLFLLAAYFSLFITLTNTTYIGIGIAALFVVWYSLCKVNRLKNLAINGILLAIAGGIAEFLWRNPCTPRAIDTDSVSKLLLAHRLYLVPGILGMVIILLFLLGTVFPEKIRTKMDTCVERVLSKVWIWLIIVGFRNLCLCNCIQKCRSDTHKFLPERAI